MQLEMLQAFCEVFERRSFSAAARALGIDPSVVSRRIKALENEMNVALFYRSTRAVSATAAADAFYSRIAPALRVIAEAELAVRSGNDQLRGSIRVAAPVALGRARVGPVVHRFCLAHPEVRVELLLADRHIDLLEEGVDLAIRPQEPGMGSLIVRRIAVSEQWVVAAPEYLRSRTPLTTDPTALAGHSVVLRRTGGSLLDFRAWLPESVRDQIGVSFISDDMGAIADAVIAGLGFGVVPRWLAEPGCEAGLLVRIPIGPQDLKVPVFAVLPAGRRSTARTRALLDALVEDWAD
ncbi:MAG: LysR family transcriptional regulator [Myxococcota bacterium]